MQKHIKNLYKGSLFFIAIIITITITILSLIKIEKQPISFSHLDKVEHCIAYFFLSLSWMLAIKEVSHKPKIKYVIVTLCIIFGILIEVLQVILTNYREASFLDILANSIGVLLAMLIFNKFFEKNTVI